MDGCVQRLGRGAPVEEVLRALHQRARARGLPPPAALTGSWFGSRAVLAPSVEALPVAGLPEVSPVDGPPGAVGGGWVGYLGFPDGRGALPAAAGGWTDDVLRLDDHGCWWFESLRGQPCPDDLRAALDGAAATPWRARWDTPDRAAHERRVHAALGAVADGEIYQVCLSTRWRGRLDGDPLELFAAGVSATAPVRAAWLAGSWGAVASLSPELFLARHGATVTSSPIKGTLPRAHDPARLRASAKDVAENIMITDLVRNDLGRVCRPGSVRVTELLGVHAAPAVWHLVSTVVGELVDGTTDAALLAATFPPASVTGTPKQRARELLAGWEPVARGVHCGAVGLSSPWAGLELGVAIRTVEVSPDGRLELGVGGGITADSDPAAEWQECFDKASAVLDLDGAPVQRRAASTAS